MLKIKKLMKRIKAGAVSLSMVMATIFGMDMQVSVRADETNQTETSVTEEFVIEDGVLLKYNGDSTDIVIPDGVKEITSQAICFASGMTNFGIKIPNSVTKIAKDAVYTTSSSGWDMGLSAGGKRIIGGFGSCAEEYAKTNSYFSFIGKVDDFYCMKEDDGIIIYSVDSKATAVTIPEEIEGLPVTKINENCFIECSALLELDFQCENLGIWTASPWTDKILDFSYCEALNTVSFGKQNLIEAMDFSDTAITQIDGLKLTEVAYLDLSNTDITDISFLSDIKSLKILNLSNTKIEDMAVLESLNLRSLIIDDANISASYMSGIIKPVTYVSGDSVSHVQNYMKLPIRFFGYSIEMPSDVDSELSVDEYAKCLKDQGISQAEVTVKFSCGEKEYQIPWKIIVGKLESNPECSEKIREPLTITSGSKDVIGLTDKDNNLWKIKKSPEGFIVSKEENVKEFKVLNHYIENEYSYNIQDILISKEYLLNQQGELFVDGIKVAEDVVEYDSSHALTKSGDLIFFTEEEKIIITQVAAYASDECICSNTDGKGYELDEFGNDYSFLEYESVDGGCDELLILKKDGLLYYYDEDYDEKLKWIANDVKEVYDSVGSGKDGLCWLTEDGKYYHYDYWDNEDDEKGVLMFEDVEKVLGFGIVVKEDGTTWVAYPGYYLQPTKIFEEPIVDVINIYSKRDGFTDYADKFLYLDSEQMVWSMSVDRNEETDLYEVTPVKVCENSKGLVENAYTTYLNLRVNGFIDEQGRACAYSDEEGVILYNTEWYLDAEGNFCHNGELVLTKVKEYKEMIGTVILIREDNTVWAFSTDMSESLDNRLVQIELDKYIEEESPDSSDEPSKKPEDSEKPITPPGESQQPIVSPSVSGEPIVTTPPVISEEVVLGDVNGDDEIALGDAQMALRAALLLDKLDEIQKKAADVDKNGAVELKDAQQILRRALLLIEEFITE